jgi:hypothetical protein
MNRLPDSANGPILPFVGLPCPDGFDVCWVGEFSVPDPLVPPLICLGSVDGKLLFTDQEFGHTLKGKMNASPSGEAINGVARIGNWVAISTRSEVNICATTKPGGVILPHGAHGITASRGGYFIAPLGLAGVMTATPSENGVAFTSHTPGDGKLNVYRALCLRTTSGKEVLVCAARTDGIVVGSIDPSADANSMRIARFDGLDVVDICALTAGTGALPVAILGRDGSIILCRDVQSDRGTKTFKFQSVQGAAYRILSHGGDVYVLTSRGLHVLGRLAARFINDEGMEEVTTQIMPLPMSAIDMSIVWDKWLLVVLANEVRKFDADFIHDFVPQHIGEGDIQESQSIAPAIESEWSNINSTMESLAAAS